MSGVTKKLMSASGGVAGFTAIEDVFSTYIFDGDNGGVTISNGIDLANEGGLVWNKDRTASYGQGHALIDTERGPNKILATELSNAETTTGNAITFNSDGYSCTAGVSSATGVFNASGFNIASWTFRKAPRFFDVVTYTGDGTSNRQIAHNIGGTVGFIILKRYDSLGNWVVWHKDVNPGYGLLDNTAEFTTGSNGFFENVTDKYFQTSFLNSNGAKYVAYLYAHDPLGPSGDGSDGLIACGSYIGNGNAAGQEVNLGFEPQWLFLKSASGVSDERSWALVDTTRGFTNNGFNGTDSVLKANSTQEEITMAVGHPTSNGFSVGQDNFNKNAVTYIYIAIRRGPMRAPTSGTEVFKPLSALVTSNPQSFVTGFPADFIWSRRQNATSEQPGFVPKLTRRALYPNSTSAEVDASDPSGSFVAFDSNDRVTTGGYYSAGFGSVQSLVAFRRAPEFFDVVAYTGNGVAGRTVPHNLGVAPEMMIVKRRDSIDAWSVYSSTLGNAKWLQLNREFAEIDDSDGRRWNLTNPTETVFSLGFENSVNASGGTYIAYLSATLAGVSKVGSYTGNGTSQTINCGFTTGARFIIIKRTDAAGDWYVWDTARGIVAANDPHLSLNTTAAEVTTDDSVDPVSSGFIVNQVAATNINVSAASYIFYAVA